MRLCQLHFVMIAYLDHSKASRQSTSLLSRAKQQLLCPHCSRKQNSIMHNSVISWKVISANMLVRTSVKCIVNRTNGLVVITFCWQVFTDPFQVFKRLNAVRGCKYGEIPFRLCYGARTPPGSSHTNLCLHSSSLVNS